MNETVITSRGTPSLTTATEFIAWLESYGVSTTHLYRVEIVADCGDMHSYMRCYHWKPDDDGVLRVNRETGEVPKAEPLYVEIETLPFVPPFLESPASVR